MRIFRIHTYWFLTISTPTGKSNFYYSTPDPFPNFDTLAQTYGLEDGFVVSFISKLTKRQYEFARKINLNRGGDTKRA